MYQLYGAGASESGSVFLSSFVIHLASYVRVLYNIELFAGLGWYLVAGNNGDRAGQRRAAQFGSASDAGALPHSEEQPAAVDGELHQVVQRICRSLPQQRSRKRTSMLRYLFLELNSA